MNRQVQFARSTEGEYPEHLFYQICEEKGIASILSYYYSLEEGFTLDKGVIDKLKGEFKSLYEEVYYEDSIGSKDKKISTVHEAALYKEHIPVYIKYRSRYSVTINVGSSDESVLNEIVGIAQKYAKPVSNNMPENAYNVNFWFYSSNGPKCKTRKFTEQTVEEVTKNYNEEDRKKIEFLKNYKPKKGGELLLFTGEAGVGKSNLLLALFNEWKNWAMFNYVLDSHTLFSGNPSYIIDLILNRESVPADYSDKPLSDIYADDSDVEKKKEGKWNIFILEDCGEMLSVNAKEKQGQALSTFLNITDGFIGRGIKTIVIVTTNEELEKLHPAVSRPGRCTFYHKFGKLSVNESIAWLDSMGHPELATKVEKPQTLAELYAMIGGSLDNLSELKTLGKKIGFQKS